MIKRFQDFLGPVRFWLLFGLLVSTAFLSFVFSLGSGDNPNSLAIQTALVLIFVIGAAIIVGSRMERFEQWRWLAILAPAVGLIVLGTLFLQDWFGVLLGAALGWIVAGWFLFIRSRAPREYRLAVRHMRKNEYEEAVAVMTGMIKDEPDEPNHYRFRAELLRLWGKLGRAKRDYQKMVELEPDSAVGYNGLAEVHLQADEYGKAHEAGLKAYVLAPDEWVAAYNLGMIEDRLQRASEAIEHLEKALELKVPDSRHRLLIHLYRLRAYQRLGDHESASQVLAALQKEKGGLREWQQILGSDQAETLRHVLADDIQTVENIIQNPDAFLNRKKKVD